MTARTRTWRIGVGAIAALAVAYAPASEAALPAPALAVSPPQGATTGFATPQIVAVQGQALSFLNADTVTHTVTSVATKPVKVRYGKKVYTVRVPIFDSGVIAGTAIGDVKNVSGLKPGAYQFLCALHTGMKGTLTVVAAPAAT